MKEICLEHLLPLLRTLFFGFLRQVFTLLKYGMKLGGGTTEIEKVAFPSHFITVSEGANPIELLMLVGNST